MAICTKHAMLQADAACGSCGHSYCAECLVRPFGPARPPLCIRCALSISGVSTTRVAKRRATQRRRSERPESRRRADRRRASAAVEPLGEHSIRPGSDDAPTGPAALPEWANR